MGDLQKVSIGIERFLSITNKNGATNFLRQETDEY